MVPSQSCALGWSGHFGVPIEKGGPNTQRSWEDLSHGKAPQDTRFPAHQAQAFGVELDLQGLCNGRLGPSCAPGVFSATMHLSVFNFPQNTVGCPESLEGQVT